MSRRGLFVRKPLRSVASMALLAAVMPVSHAHEVHATHRPTDKALGTVVVSATATEKTLQDAPASIAVIAGEDLRKRPMRDIGEAVRNMPGVMLDDVGLGNTGVSIRGMDSGHTLFLMDGQRISASSSGIAHSNYELQWLPAEAIERVEVVRGPMSSLYGSEALGGVVNMITRKATDVWQGSVTSYALMSENANSSHHYKTGVYAGGPLIKGVLGMNVWGQVSHRTPTHDAGNAVLSVLDRQKSTNAHVGLTWTPTSVQRMDVTYGEGDETRTGMRGTPVYASEDAITRHYFSLAHTGQWAAADTHVRVYRSTLHRVNTRSDGGALSGPNTFADTVLDGKVSFSSWHGNTITTGIEAREETLQDPTVNHVGKSTLHHYAFFAQDDVALSTRLNLVVGARVDAHSQFGNAVSPRAYVLYHFSDAWALKAGVGRGFKAPSLKQISPEYASWAAMGGRGIIYGNPDLQPETNTAYELGVEYTQGATTGRAMLFQNNVNNLIETQRMPTCAVAKKTCLNYRNVGRVVMQGIELGGSLALSPHWHVDTNYMYLHAQDSTTQQPLADRSRHSANVQLAWFVTDKISATAKAEYIGAQYRSAVLADRPGYTLLSLYADMAIATHLKMHVGIENMTDKRLANDDASVYGRADEGRRYFVSMTATF